MLHLRLAVFLLAALAPLSARPNSDWPSAVARLHQGDHLLIQTRTGAVSTAIFQSADANTITLDSGALPRTEVLKIERLDKKGGSRWRHVALGAALGSGGGAIIGGSISPLKLFQSNLYTRKETAFALAGAGAIVGAAIGAVLPAHPKRQVVYRAP